MNQLATLLLRKQGEGISFEAMARRARSQGFDDMSRQYIQAVVKGRVARPSPYKLAGLAAGLPGVTEAEVQEAAARSFGVHTEHNIDYRTSELLNQVSRMSAANRERWNRLSLALARELAAEEDGSLAGRTVALSPPGVPTPSRESAAAMNEVLVAAEERAHKANTRRKRS